MNDYSRQEYEAGRPNDDALHCINFCLDALYLDTVHCMHDTITDGCQYEGVDGRTSACTYEELIGALLKARDELLLNEEPEWDE